MGTAIKHPVTDRVKPSFVIFDLRALWHSECLDVKNYKWQFNPVCHRMLYCCSHMATVGVKGFYDISVMVELCLLLLCEFVLCCWMLSALSWRKEDVML